MLYYHFTNKAALYREVLVDMFQSTARAVRAVRDAGGTPEAQIRGFIQAFAREGLNHHRQSGYAGSPGAAGISARPSSLKMRGVFAVLAEILPDGRARGVFDDAPPAKFRSASWRRSCSSCAASAGCGAGRGRVSPSGDHAPPTLEAVVRHVEATTLVALGARRPQGRCRRRVRNAARRAAKKRSRRS